MNTSLESVSVAVLFLSYARVKLNFPERPNPTRLIEALEKMGARVNSSLHDCAH